MSSPELSEKNTKLSPEFKSSHNMTSKYATLQEVNDTEMEAWLYFIRYDGNEINLKYLRKQLESVEWYIMDDCSTFDIDIDNLVSAQTAKEMTKVELNSHQWHRKFDGTLDRVDFEFRKKDSNETKMCKVFDYLSYGQIEDYISDEDIDEEDLEDDTENDSLSSEEDAKESDSDHEKQRRRSTKEQTRRELPPSLLNNSKSEKARKHKKGVLK